MLPLQQRLAMAFPVALLLCCISFGVVESRSLVSQDDRITSLPGQPAVTFQQYSGYVTVDDRKSRALFYYFVEAETDPASKPLVLWLNGGPGCSSLGIGAFSENGPFKPQGQGLAKNEHSWNKEANMLYLESPIGVGFSYSTDSSSYVGVNDKITAEDNLEFMKRWFLKFPQYANRSLYITGESYGGHYIPQLALLMLQYNEKDKLFNLKGIAMGNPVLEFETDFDSRAEYIWSHGGTISQICARVMSQVSTETSRFVDIYDVTLDVCIPSVLSQSKVISPNQVGETVDVCVHDETVNYLNRQDVQKALHAQLVGAPKWDVCSSVLDYERTDMEIPTINVVGNLVQAGISVLVYSGDQDSVIPLIGSRTLLNQLAQELGLRTTVPYRVWFTGQQVGGWTEVYGNILSFATVRGAAHEVPFSQPERSLVLFKAFLDGQPLPESFS